LGISMVEYTTSQVVGQVEWSPTARLALAVSEAVAMAVANLPMQPALLAWPTPEAEVVARIPRRAAAAAAEWS